MSVPPLDTNSMMLASHVTKVYSLIHRVAYALVSPDLMIKRISTNFTAVLNEPSPAIVGQELTDLIWEFIGAEESLQGVLRGSLPYLAFERVARQGKDGRTIYLDFTVTRLSDSDLGEGLLLIVEDVTHTAEMEQKLVQHRNELMLTQNKLRKANQALRRLNRLKTLFLSMAVHDLRTPLTVIRSYADLVIRALPGNLPQKIYDFLQVIRLQTNRLDWLIDNFLDLDQIEQGDLRLRRQPVELKQLVKEVVDMVVYLAERRQQKLTLHLPNTPLPSSVDADRIQQVLYNLLSNALKYTPMGGEITVTLRAEGDRILLQVADNGPGMNEDTKAKAFQIYYRADNVQETRGKGLGLYIVKVLVEAHGGSVKLESEEGQGSTFSVYLPRMQST